MALGLAALAAAAPAAGVEPVLVSIGTGGKTGVYYIAGGAICGYVDAQRWETGLRCLLRLRNAPFELVPFQRQQSTNLLREIVFGDVDAAVTQQLLGQ